MKQETKELTRKYMGEKTLHEWAKELGLDRPADELRSLVWGWKSGTVAPSLQTLTVVFNSPESTPEAKSWATECLALYGVQPITTPIVQGS